MVNPRGPRRQRRQPRRPNRMTNRQRRRTNMTVDRMTQSRRGFSSPDPSGTNFITRRPFSYKVTTPLTTQSLKLSTQYSVLFPDLNITAIQRVRIDRVTVWGTTVPDDSTSEKTVFLEVGDDFSRADQPGVNQRAHITCIPRLIDGGANEETVIKFANARLLHIQGVVMTRRATMPSIALTDTTQTAPMQTQSAFTPVTLSSTTDAQRARLYDGRR